MKTIKVFLLFVFILIAEVSCKKDKTPDIVGKWKLEKVKLNYYPDDYDSPTEFDYSGNNIIYQFRANGTLKVMSDIGEYMAKKPGEYSYRLKKVTHYTETDVIVINDGIEYYYTISGNNMTIGDLSGDGPTSYFTRVK